MLISFKEARLYLGVSTSTLYRMMQRREVVGFFIAHRWKFKQSDLDRLLEENTSVARASL